MPSLRRIKLTRTPQSVFNPYTTLALRFTVDAADGYLIDDAVFKMIRSPVDPNNSDSPTRDIYLGVCTPGEMSDLTVNNPPGDDATAAFRVAHIDLTYSTETEAEDSWEAIQSGVTALKEALDATDILGVAETVWIGTPP